MEDLKPIPMIHAAMAKCMAEIGAVGKLGKNVEQKYAFRALADVYKSCQPVLAKNGVHFAPFAIHEYTCRKYDRETQYGVKYTFHVTMRVEHRFYASDGSYIPVVTIGEAIDFSDKASNKAMSASAKYALVQAFCLPEEDPDADADHTSPEIEAPKPAPKDAEAKQPQPVEPPTRHKASKDEALRLMAALDKLGITTPGDAWEPPAEATTPAAKKAALQAFAKHATLTWVNDMRKPLPMVSGLLELYADEIIPLLEKAKAGEMPQPDPLPEFMEAKAAGASMMDIEK